MDSLTRNPGVPQFRCRPFAAGAVVPFDYRPVVERAQLEIAFRKFNEQGAETWMSIVSLWIAAIAISTGWPCMSLGGNRANAASFSCETATSSNALCQLSSSGKISRGCHEQDI